MTKKHLQFCIYYMQVGDPQVAYKMTYPRVAVKSLGAAVSRLMARPEVAEWVNGTEERVHNRMMRKFHNEHYDEFKEKLLSINEKRTVLTKIITGETKRVRYIKGKYGPQKVEEDLPVYAVLRAVDLDTRLENFYNYLTRSDTWRKAQNIYVNTPTLQQQVNILISQTNQKEENKDVVQADIESPQIPSPPGRGARKDSAEGGWVHSRQEIPPLKEVPHEHGAEDVLAPDTRESETCLPFRGIGGELAPGTPEEPHATQEQALSPAACPTKCESGTLSPAGGGVRLRRTGAASASGVMGHSHRTDNTSPHPGDLGVHPRRTPPSPPRGEGQGVRPLATKKTPRYLTKLNKTPLTVANNVVNKT